LIANHPDSAEKMIRYVEEDVIGKNRRYLKYWIIIKIWLKTDYETMAKN